MDPYQELGVGRDASEAELRAAHRAAAKRHHPDRGGDAERFHRLQRAFDLLRDPERRRAYDETGEWPDAPAAGLEQRAAAAARKALMAVVLGAQDLARIDVVSAALQFVTAQVEALRAQRQQAERNLERLADARARLRNMSDEPDVAADIFAAQAAELRAALPRIDHEIEVQEAATDILKRYAYTFEMDGRPVSVWREGREMHLTLG